MTGENSQKTFDVLPTDYLTWIMSKITITNPYIKSKSTQHSLKVVPQEASPVMLQQSLKSREKLCPTCKNNLLFVEQKAVVSASNADTVVVLLDNKITTF